MSRERDQRSVMVIAAHPDDEVLGCGGTLALHARAGDRVQAVIVCEGESLRYGEEGVDLAGQARAAADKLGLTPPRFLGLPDQGLDTLSLVEVITPLEEAVRELEPELVYCQWGGDLNRDHQLLFQAALVALRPSDEFRGAVYAFETASSTEWAYPQSFRPDTWVDISQTLELKLAALACYHSEMRRPPHPRSAEALAHQAHWRGAQACLAAAEAFLTVRRVVSNGQAPA